MMAAPLAKAGKARQGVILSETGSDVAAWARAHGASFEATPLVEMVKGRQVQVGFTISLYARLPLEEGPGAERRAAVAKVQEGLREILQRLTEREGSRARAEIEAPRQAAFFEPGGGKPPDVALSARVFHADDYFTEVTADEERGLRRASQRLVEMGLTERRPPIR
jgi:hypothetical protein